MPTLKINGRILNVPPGTLLIEACKQAGFEIPHYCYHHALTPVATCRMCAVEIVGQPKLVTSCSTPVAEGMDILTESEKVKDHRAGIMEFLLLNHPLDCPICDQAGECRLQDYSYQHGSGDSRMTEPRRRSRYEDLGGKIVLDKNRCIHCTRCVRFFQEITGTHELTMIHRGAHLEVSTYEGRSLDTNPFAANIVDLCPVGALTSRDFRFHKRVWYLKSTPSISRHSALGHPIWVDHEGNRAYRFRPRPQADKPQTTFISDEERYAYHHYDIPSQERKALRQGLATTAEEALMAYHANTAPVLVIGQGTFGNGSAQALAGLASKAEWIFGCGTQTHSHALPGHLPKNGLLNRLGFQEQGFRFDQLETVLSIVREQSVKLILLYDDLFSDESERSHLQAILEKASFSMVFESRTSSLGQRATVRLPLTTFLEESDCILNPDNELHYFEKALKAPKEVYTLPEWAPRLQSIP